VIVILKSRMKWKCLSQWKWLCRRQRVADDWCRIITLISLLWTICVEAHKGGGVWEQVEAGLHSKLVSVLCFVSMSLLQRASQSVTTLLHCWFSDFHSWISFLLSCNLHSCCLFVMFVLRKCVLAFFIIICTFWRIYKQVVKITHQITVVR